MKGNSNKKMQSISRGRENSDFNRSVRKKMKKKTTIILLILSFIIGSIAGLFGTGLFMKRYILRFDTLNRAETIMYLHNALRSADSGNLVETQKKLETFLKFSFFSLDFDSDFTGCPSAEKSVQKAKLYIKERNENKTKPNK